MRETQTALGEGQRVNCVGSPQQGIAQQQPDTDSKSFCYYFRLPSGGLSG
jgi:hypothetical protein